MGSVQLERLSALGGVRFETPCNWKGAIAVCDCGGCDWHTLYAPFPPLIRMYLRSAASLPLALSPVDSKDSWKSTMRLSCRAGAVWAGSGGGGGVVGGGNVVSGSVGGGGRLALGGNLHCPTPAPISAQQIGGWEASPSRTAIKCVVACLLSET